LPVGDTSAARHFYEQAFGWSLTEFGPTYAATTTGDTDIGLQADPDEATKGPLPVIEVEDLEAALGRRGLLGGLLLLEPGHVRDRTGGPPDRQAGSYTYQRPTWRTMRTGRCMVSTARRSRSVTRSSGRSPRARRAGTWATEISSGTRSR